MAIVDVKQLEIPERLSNLAHVIEKLDEGIHLLEARLSSVLNVAPPGGNEAPEKAIKNPVPLAEELDKYIHQIQVAASQVDRIIARCEL